MTAATCTTATRTVVNERSKLILRVAFTDENGDPFSPDTVTCRIDDPTHGRIIRAATPVDMAPGSPPVELTEVDITVTADENVSYDARQYQRRLVTLEWTWDTGHATTEWEYFVKGIRGVISGSE